jgi:tRNA modification GTPase
MTDNRTIFAVSSGAGRAAISVIRVSGPAAAEIIQRLAGAVPRPRAAALRLLKDQENTAIDEAVVLWFPAPGSFTGEDVAEFHVHGSPAVVARLLDVLAGFDLVVPAEPGEFTRRAFENGKLDLLSVEGLADLIAAETEEQRRQAWFHKAGGASGVFDDWRSQLVAAQANLEAAIDFSDEEDVEEQAVQAAFAALRNVEKELEKALARGPAGERIRDGVRVVLAGATNVGKSSLLNELAQRDAAIVSHIHGTTRDVIEVQMDLGGVPVVLVDTAGLREESGDEIEQIGMGRSVAQIEAADITVWVEAVGVKEERGLPATDSDTLRILNKADLAASADLEGIYDAVVSAKTRQGLDGFVELLSDRVRTAFVRQEPALITRARHRVAVEGCLGHIESALQNRNLVLELVAEDVRLAVRDMERLIGRVDVEDVLDVIFRDFCIGK